MQVVKWLNLPYHTQVFLRQNFLEQRLVRSLPRCLIQEPPGSEVGGFVSTIAAARISSRIVSTQVVECYKGPSSVTRTSQRFSQDGLGFEVRYHRSFGAGRESAVYNVGVDAVDFRLRSEEVVTTLGIVGFGISPRCVELVSIGTCRWGASGAFGRKVAVAARGDEVVVRIGILTVHIGGVVGHQHVVGRAGNTEAGFGSSLGIVFHVQVVASLQ